MTIMMTIITTDTISHHDCLCHLSYSCYSVSYFPVTLSILPSRNLAVHQVISSYTMTECPVMIYNNYNKKLRYRKEHSMYVVLSRCTLLHFSGENLLMANRPLLHNWPQKLPNSAK